MKRIITTVRMLSVIPALVVLTVLVQCTEFEFDNPYDETGTNYSIFTITFNANGGTVSPASAETGTNGKLASLPTPRRSSYEFDGWYTSSSGGTEVTANTVFGENTTIYARWETVSGTTKYTITFNANGGTVSPTSATTGANGKLTTLPTPSRSGYEFDGWYTAETGGEEVTVNTVFGKDATVYARWEAVSGTTKFTITFDAGDGTVSPASAVTGTNGRLASLPTPTRSGYKFNGWFTAETGGEEVKTTTVFSKDATVYAQWEAIPSLIVYGPPVTYDGETYQTVVIGTQTWFARNLNYDVPNVDTDVCYENDADSCEKYGRLYDWATAMGIDKSYNSSKWGGSDENHQGICPTGWHVPSDAEWATLVEYVGDSSGTKLKSTAGWDNKYNTAPAGTDDYGFSALPGGNGWSGNFGGAGYNGQWWSATEEYNNSAYYWGTYQADVNRYNDATTRKSNPRSVRCVQD